MSADVVSAAGSIAAAVIALAALVVAIYAAVVARRSAVSADRQAEIALKAYSVSAAPKVSIDLSCRRNYDHYLDWEVCFTHTGGPNVLQWAARVDLLIKTDKRWFLPNDRGQSSLGETRGMSLEGRRERFGSKQKLLPDETIIKVESMILVRYFELDADRNKPPYSWETQKMIDWKPPDEYITR